MKACPYPAEPGGELCARHRDLRAPEPVRRKLITLYSRGLARPVVPPLAGRPVREESKSHAAPPKNGQAANQQRQRPQKSARAQATKTAPPPPRPTAPTTGRAARRKMAERLRALDQPSEGQIAKARGLGIDPAGMGRRQLQQQIEAARRDSGGRNQEQWLAGVIERELTWRLDAVLATRPEQGEPSTT